jgi:hypothetical protein
MTRITKSAKCRLLNSTENLAFDINIHPFYGGLVPECIWVDGSCIIVTGYCYSPVGAMGFYGFNSLSSTPVGAIDMGALVDTSAGCTGNPPTSVPQQDYLYSNNGIVGGVISRPVFQPQEPSLPYTLVLQNQKILVQNLYNSSNIYSNKTTQSSAFANNDVFSVPDGFFAGQSGPPTPVTFGVGWIRIRTPPPNNIFPQQQ